MHYRKQENWEIKVKRVYFEKKYALHCNNKMKLLIFSQIGISFFIKFEILLLGTTYIVGGISSNQCLNSLLSLKNNASNWCALSPMNEKRSSHAIVSHSKLIFFRKDDQNKCFKKID